MDALGIRRFQTADVAHACGIPFAALHHWLARDLVDLVGDPGLSPGSGRRRLFSRRGVRHIALTAELVRLGLSVRRASRAALHFSNVGEAPGGFEGERLDRSHPDWRDPGGLFKTGRTMLFVSLEDRDEGSVPTATVKLVDGEHPALWSLFDCADRQAPAASVIAVDLNELCARIDPERVVRIVLIPT